ncbi:MAG: hypothetical protein AB1847_03280 [bacterium]
MAIEDKASKLAVFIRCLTDFTVVDEIGGNYQHIGATIADAVLQANMHYETHVRPRVTRIRNIFPKAATITGLRKLLSEQTVNDFLNWRGMDRAKRFQDIVNLFSSEGIDSEEDLKNWLMNDRNLMKLDTIQGIGPKTIDYFKILTGIQTCAIDRRLFDFLKKAGIETSDYHEAKSIINSTADIMRIPRAYLDHSIWEYIGRGSSLICK